MDGWVGEWVGRETDRQVIDGWVMMVDRWMNR